MLLFLLGGALAADHAAEPHEITFEFYEEVFSSLAYDTGYWPDYDDLISVRFHLTPVGGLAAVIPASSEMEWLPLEQRVARGEELGFVGAEVEVEVAAEVHLDIPLVYDGSIDIFTRQMVLGDSLEFESLLLPNSPVPSAGLVTTDSGLVEPLDYAFSIITGVGLVFGADLYPELYASLQGESVETTLAGSTDTQLSEAAWNDFSGLSGDLEGQAIWRGTREASLTFVLEPHVSIDTFIGDFELLSFPIDVDLVNSVEPVEMTAELAHGLPGLGPTDDVLDFGEVDLGAERSLTLSFDNFGGLALEGDLVVVQAEGSFSVFPETIYAPDLAGDGVVVTFRPDTPGPLVGTLVLRSNDPAHPEVEIDLLGVGYYETDTVPDTETDSTTDRDPVDTGADGPPDDTDGVTSSGSTEDQKKGCGCSSASPSAGWLLLLGLAAMRTSRGGGRRARGRTKQ